jgi:hypothetical protein
VEWLGKLERQKQNHAFRILSISVASFDGIFITHRHKSPKKTPEA